MSGFFSRCKQPDYRALKLLTSQIARRCLGWHRWPEIPRLGRTLSSAAEADCSDELRVTLAITSLAGKLPQSTATRAGTSPRASDAAPCCDAALQAVPTVVGNWRRDQTTLLPGFCHAHRDARAHLRRQPATGRVVAECWLRYSHRRDRGGQPALEAT